MSLKKNSTQEAEANSINHNFDLNQLVLIRYAPKPLPNCEQPHLNSFPSHKIYKLKLNPQ
ncbi:hypothetical protein PMIN07_004835 [Paraphaeosphaeria minitans]